MAENPISKKLQGSWAAAAAASERATTSSLPLRDNEVDLRRR